MQKRGQMISEGRSGLLGECFGEGAVYKAENYNI